MRFPDRRLCPQGPHERGDAFGVHRVCEPAVALERAAHDEAVGGGQEIAHIRKRRAAAQQNLGAGARAADAFDIRQLRRRPVPVPETMSALARPRSTVSRAASQWAIAQRHGVLDVDVGKDLRVWTNFAADSEVSRMRFPR